MLPHHNASKSFLQRGDPTLVEPYYKKKMEEYKASTEAKPLPFDGYFEVGCYSDNTPQSMVVYSPKGDKVSPKQCFNFCRDKPLVRFFGLTLGRQCYCTPYPTLGGGNGGCTRQCEGDGTFMCGGDGMSTVYEMHRCGDVTEVAAKDKKAAEDLVEKVHFFSKRANYVVLALTEAGKSIDVADVRTRVFALAATLEELRADVVLKAGDVEEKLAPLTSALAAFDASSATAAMMKAVEDAQADVMMFVAAMEDADSKLQTYWSEHSLDMMMSFRNIDSKSLGSRAELAKDLSTDVHFLPTKVRTELAEHIDDSDFTYVVVGKENLASLFQVYSVSNPIEGRPTLSSFSQFKKWAVKECHQICLMTPGCVGGNALGARNSQEDADKNDGLMFAFTCNLKGDVERVEMSSSGASSRLVSGFMFESYYKMHSKDITFNTANVLEGR
jgi:ribosomal protein L12E/L44/L45/RPP1/RPP2